MLDRKSGSAFQTSILAAFLILLNFSFAVCPITAAEQKEGSQAAITAMAKLDPEIATEEVQRILIDKSAPVIDVRSEKEYAIAHIPGSINIYEKETDAIMNRFPDKGAALIIYCNGPFCHKVKRVAEQLIKRGYTNVRRYQLGLPVWRAFGNTVQTDMLGFKYIFAADKTAVFVDARSKEEFIGGTVPGAVNVQAGEAEAANTDGRLPYTDKGTRIIVFADKPGKARSVAEEISQKAFWNSSYFGGTFDELKHHGLW
jgi:rhodanese-related sulfurtransferase